MKLEFLCTYAVWTLVAWTDGLLMGSEYYWPFAKQPIASNWVEQKTPFTAYPFVGITVNGFVISL